MCKVEQGSITELIIRDMVVDKLSHSLLHLPVVCHGRLRNDLYCVGWGVKLYSIQSHGDKRLLDDATEQIPVGL